MWAPSARLPHCAAIRQKPAARSHSASAGPHSFCFVYLCRFRFQPINQLHKWIKTDNAWPVSNKIRKRIDIVIETVAIAIIRNVLNAAKLDARSEERRVGKA